MATEKNTTIYRGGSYEVVVTLLDEDGTALDPTGMGTHYRIAWSKGKDPALSIDTADITTALDGSEWKATIPLTSARTKTLAAGHSYYHELYVDDAGEVSVMMQGQITVKEAQAAKHE